MGRTYRYRVRINGKEYEVEIEEIGMETVVRSVSRTSSPVPGVLAPAPATAPTASAPKPSSVSSGDGLIKAPIPGKVLKILVTEGDRVSEGQTLIIFEAMKMENEIKAPVSGVVKKIYVSEGANFNTGDPLIEISQEG